MSITRLGLAFSVAAAILSGQDFRITSGLQQEQVLQRGLDGTAEVAVSGTINGKKTVGKRIECQISAANGVVTAFDWIPVGLAQKQTWAADIRGIPTGGPYRLQFRVQGIAGSFATVDNILVGDLWILAGQSNMEGLGDLVDLQSPDPLIHSFDMADRWRVADEPLHTLLGATDRVHWRRNAAGEPERLTGDNLQAYIQARRKGAGLGLPFAAVMVKRTGVPIGLIPCAHGGTSMDQWSPTLKSQEGDSLYGSLYRRFVAAGGKVKGVLWYQGESDASPQAVKAFPAKFDELVKALRADLGQPALPFYYAQIGRHISAANISEWNHIQEDQRLAEMSIPHVGMVTTVDLSLDDGIHIGTLDLKRLGRRFADRVCHDLFPRVEDFGQRKPGPRPISAVFEGGVVRVRFRDVNERLNAEGRIGGFTIHSAAGAPVPAIYKVRVDPAEASTVILSIGAPLPDNATLRYGYGKDPYCNLRDATDMAVPAFGPLAIERR